MSSRLFRLCALAIVVELFLLVSIAQSQTPFTIQETGVQHIFTDDSEPGTLYLHVENNTSNRITLRADLDGSSNFSLPHDHFVFSIPPDSSAFTIPVSFKPIPGDTSQTFLTLTDFGTFQRQTLEIWGFDLRTPSPEYAWFMSDEDIHFGRYYTSRSDEICVIAHSRSDDTITLTASILDGSYGISLIGPASVPVAPDEVSNHCFAFDSEDHDSAYAQVLVSGAGKLDTVKLYARAIGDTLYWDWREEFLNVAIPDTSCRVVTIHNRNPGHDASVTYIGALSDSAFYLPDPPTLPYLIAGGDSLELTVCYISSAYDTLAHDKFRITYVFDAQLERTHDVYLVGSSQRCITASPFMMTFDTVHMNTTASRSLVINNYKTTDITIDSASFYSGYNEERFSVATQLPLVVPARSSAEVKIDFAAGTGDGAFQYITLFSECGNTHAYLSAATYYENDSFDIALYGDQTKTLSFLGDTGRTSIVYTFYNDQQDSITILSVALAQGAHFSITNVQPSMPEFKLGPMEDMSVTLQFIGAPGAYDDTLVIVTENGFVALRFPIDAVMAGSDVKPIFGQYVQVRLSPNPSAGRVSIKVEGGRATSIEVLDMLGTLVSRPAAANGSWDGNSMAAGTYYVRVMGHAQDGKPFVITKRIVIE